MSLAISGLELANVALEDLILAELNGKICNVDGILMHHNVSRHNLNSMHTCMHNLEEQMQDENYVDLPPMKSLDLIKFGYATHIEGLHRPESSWRIIATLLQQQDFEATLRHHAKTAIKLIELTDTLMKHVVVASESEKQGNLSAALEQNLAQNFKREFARLYTTWANFQKRIPSVKCDLDRGLVQLQPQRLAFGIQSVNPCGLTATTGDSFKGGH